MSDYPKEPPPDKGEGRTEEGATSAPPQEDERSGTPKASPDDAVSRSGVSEIPIGIPMTDEQWRQAKKHAESADTED